MNTTHSETGSGTTPTKQAINQIMAAALDAAFDEMATDAADLDEIRQYLRDHYGAQEGTPLDYIFTGFALGFTKGLQAATGSTG